MSKHETERRVPNLRFKGFTDDWMQQKLSTLVELLRSYPLSRKYETLTKSGTRYVHYGDIHTGVVNIINKENELPSILEEEYKTLKKGDIILADASEDYQGIAWPAVLNINPIEDIVAGLHTIALRPKNDVDSLFMYYTFLTTDFRKFGYRMGTGMKVFGITSNNLLKYDFKLPSKIDEQIKVRNIIGLINNIITLEQEKVKKIEQLKESFLQNLFPKKDHYIQELRIQGFSKDWETIKLGSILSKGNRKKVDNPNNYNRLTVKLHKRGLEKFIPDRHMANTRPFYQRFSGELIIGKQNYFNGSLAIVSDEFDGYISSNAIMSFSILRADINF